MRIVRCRCVISHRSTREQVDAEEDAQNSQGAAISSLSVEMNPSPMSPILKLPFWQNLHGVDSSWVNSSWVGSSLVKPSSAQTAVHSFAPSRFKSEKKHALSVSGQGDVTSASQLSRGSIKSQKYPLGQCGGIIRDSYSFPNLSSSSSSVVLLVKVVLLLLLVFSTIDGGRNVRDAHCILEIIGVSFATVIIPDTPVFMFWISRTMCRRNRILIRVLRFIFAIFCGLCDLFIPG
mmetsp:Transcript_4816/g.10203  ORF Transcript_4816/g.10203 Transcript_4816/m.10203 type:complete len:234 (-) Transcript_4816:90-791(-)